MVSPIRELIRRIPVQDESKGRPLPKDLAKLMLSDPEYLPVPPEACECGILKRGVGGTVSWKKCTMLGKLDGERPEHLLSLPDYHVRMGTGDYLFGALQLRACKRVT